MFFFALKRINITKVVFMEKKEQFKVVTTYDSTGDTIENIFCNIFKQRLLSCEQAGLDSPQGEVVQCEAQDK